MNSYKVQVLESFLSPAECSAIVNEIESVGFENQFSGDRYWARSKGSDTEVSTEDFSAGTACCSCACPSCSGIVSRHISDASASPIIM